MATLATQDGPTIMRELKFPIPACSGPNHDYVQAGIPPNLGEHRLIFMCRKCGAVREIPVG
jgi:hypothetical protein